jgi:hypothetical protein
LTVVPNWELQLADAMAHEDEPLLAAAREARERARRQQVGAALEILWTRLVSVPRRDGRRRAFLLLHMGHVYRQWMIEVAFRFFRDARQLACEADFMRGEMVAECSLGRLYLDWGEPERALGSFERGLALARACAGRWWQRNVLEQVVGCLEALGRTTGARVRRRRLEQMDVELAAELWGGGDRCRS